MRADDQQDLRAYLEAEAYDSSLPIVAHSHYIAHGLAMRVGGE